MATYTHQPNPQSFDTPIFEHPTEFLFQIARQKQGEFNAGLQAVGSELNQMSTLDVSSQVGLEKRDRYIQQAEERLKTIGTADFSLQENRSVASSVYRPLTQDKDIIYDMAETRQARSQMEYMDRLQFSKDEKERAMYWDTGRAYVNKSIMDLRGATTSEQLQKTKVRQFVPYVDVIGKLNTAAKDLGLAVSFDTVTNGYILTDKNGKKAEMPFYIFAQSQLGAQEQEVFRVMGSVESDVRVQNTMRQYGIDEGTARNMLAKEALNERFGDYQEMLQSNGVALNTQKAKKERLLKISNGQITDENIEQLSNIDQAIQAIEGSTSQIQQRIRNLGFEYVGGQWIQNKENYDKQLGAFATDLSIPYMESARKNILRNWAAGLANATTSMKVGSDPVYLKGIDLQMEVIKANAKLAEEQAKAAAAGVAPKKTAEEKKKEEEDRDPGDNILTTGLNPFGQERMTTYEFFKANQKAFQEHLYTEGTNLIQDTLMTKLGVSGAFLDAISENLQKGAFTESLIGQTGYNLEGKFAEDIKKISAAIQNGEIPGGDLTYGKLFRALIEMAEKETALQLENASTDSEQASVSRIINMKDEVRKNGEMYQIYKDDEAKINKELLSNPEFADIRNGNNLLTLSEYMDKKGGQVYTVRMKTGVGVAEPHIERQMTLSEIMKLQHERPDVKIGLFTQTPEELHNLEMLSKRIPPAKTANEVISSIEKQYNNLKTKFDKGFSDMVGNNQLKYLQTNSSGQLAYVYPLFEIPFRKQSEKFNTSEKGEVLLKEALAPEKITDETKVGNLYQLGSWSKVKPVLDNILSMAGDMKAEDGRLFYAQVGADGKNPSLVFRPTAEFLKSLETRVADLDQDVINNIKRFGIEINNSVNQQLIGEHRPSVIARLIDINNKDYGVLPELKEQGFSARVVKLTNGRGFDIEMDYKYVDPTTGEEKTIRADKRTAISGPIPQSRLDDVVSALYGDLLQFYFKYKKEKASLKQVKDQKTPPKVYTEQEYQIYLQSQR